MRPDGIPNLVQCGGYIMEVCKEIRIHGELVVFIDDFDFDGFAKIHR